MTTFDVTDDASLRAAIFEISNDLVLRFAITVTYFCSRG